MANDIKHACRETKLSNLHNSCYCKIFKKTKQNKTFQVTLELQLMSFRSNDRLKKGTSTLIWSLLCRWFLLSWKKSARPSWPCSRSRCVTWRKSRAPCVGGKTRGNDKGGGRVSERLKMRRNVKRTSKDCHLPFPPPPGSGRRWGTTCQWGARRQCTLRKLPYWTLNEVVIYTYMTHIMWTDG